MKQKIINRNHDNFQARMDEYEAQRRKEMYATLALLPICLLGLWLVLSQLGVL